MQREIQETELIFNVTANEIRGVLIEGSNPLELYYEYRDHEDLVGKIFKGKVTRVLPNIEAAFVDIGLAKDAFLEISNILDNEKNPSKDIRKNRSNIKLGDQCLVQITKNPIAKKGAKVSNVLTFSSRYFVYFSGIKRVNVSSKINNKNERERLENLMSEFVTQRDLCDGLIARTMAHGIDEVRLLKDLNSLANMCKKIYQDSKLIKSKNCLHKDLALPMRIIRDFPAKIIKKIRVDSECEFHMLTQYLTEYAPDVQTKIDFYQGDVPIFDRYNLEEHIQDAYQRSVNLPSGGNIVLDQAEAMTIIDVNSGQFSKGKDHDEMAFLLNSEAIIVIAQQLRLRNIGGIIVIDLIDMMSDKYNQIVYTNFKDIMRKDRVHSQIFPISKIGLLEMTRKQHHNSLNQELLNICPQCDGRGYELSGNVLFYRMIRTLKYRILTENLKTISVSLGKTIFRYYSKYGKSQIRILEREMDTSIKLLLSKVDHDNEYEIE